MHSKPTETDWQICDEVLDWLRLEVADEPGERDEVESVRAILDRVMRRGD
jgi:hypothetical protein